MDIIKYEAAKQALAAYKSVDDVKEYRDKAVAIEAYARQAKDFELERDAAVARLRAERRCGELLADNGAGSQGKRTDLVECDDQVKTLSEMNITKDQSSQWQKLAAIPEDDFETAVESAVEGASAISARAILKGGKGAHVSNNSGENEWYTPEKYVEKARCVMGGISLDPASCETAQETVKADRYYTLENSGLDPANEWHGSVWCNPPYCQPQISDFVTRIISELDGNISQAILLTNNSSDTNWFQFAVRRASLLCLTDGRISFINGGESCAPVRGQTFFYFGANVEGFITEFSDVGVFLSVH